MVKNTAINEIRAGTAGDERTRREVLVKSPPINGPAATAIPARRSPLPPGIRMTR
jgi:hypothetical protein